MLSTINLIIYANKTLIYYFRTNQMQRQIFTLFTNIHTQRDLSTNSKRVRDRETER